MPGGEVSFTSFNMAERRVGLDELRTASSPAARVTVQNIHIAFLASRLRFRREVEVSGQFQESQNGTTAATGGTLLPDDVRYELAPRRQLLQPSFPLANTTC